MMVITCNNSVGYKCFCVSGCWKDTIYVRANKSISGISQVKHVPILEHVEINHLLSFNKSIYWNFNLP